MVKDVITDADGATHVRYDRTFDGLRVIGGDLVSHRDRSGRNRPDGAVTWNAAHNISVPSTRPKVSLASADGAGRRRASLGQRTTLATKGELVVYAGTVGGPGEATAKLAYDVLTTGVRADQTPSRVHTVVDATTGATVASWDEIENGTGHGLHVGTVSIGTTAGPPWVMRDAAGNVTTDLHGSVTGAGTTFADADNLWGNGTITDRASAGVDAQYGAEKTFDFYKNVLGRNGIWGTGVGARSRVHYGSGYDNAFWDGTQMTYGDGAGNTHPLVELDVAGHEMTHGVTENTAGLVGFGEAGGLNEATSDIFGTSVEWYANNSADIPDYLIGELINVNGDGTPLRYLDKPSRDGFAPDCWSATVGALDVHDAAGPLNHWFYLASEGSGPKDINGTHYDSPTCNAKALSPIGRDKAVKIWYRTLTRYLTSTSTYASAREGAIQSAKDLYGATSAECNGIAAAFSAIAVPAGRTTCTAGVTRISDFTRDGITDLLARDVTGVLWLYPGNGTGGFRARRSVGAGWNAMTAIVTPGDVNGDGNGDVLARDSLGRLWLYPGNGAGALSARRQIGSGWAGYSITDAGNFNGVGRPDLFARDAAGGLWLYPLSGNAVFGPRTKVGTGWSGYTILGPGDVSGDGRADILARDASGSLWLYRGNGLGGVTARTAASTGLRAMSALATPGNWNRTGGNDMVARDVAGRLWLYPGNNAGGFSPPTVISSGWTGMTYLG